MGIVGQPTGSTVYIKKSRPPGQRKQKLRSQAVFFAFAACGKLVTSATRAKEL